MVATTSTITPRTAATPPTRDKCSSDGISLYAAYNWTDRPKTGPVAITDGLFPDFDSAVPSAILRGPFTITFAGILHAAELGREAPSAYLGCPIRAWPKAHGPNIRSAVLRTAADPRFSTCV